MGLAPTNEYTHYGMGKMLCIRDHEACNLVNHDVCTLPMEVEVGRKLTLG